MTLAVHRLAQRLRHLGDRRETIVRPPLQRARDDRIQGASSG